MRPQSAFIKWSLIGAVVAGILVFTQLLAVGGLGELIQTGETSKLRPLIQEQLGSISLAEAGGHDGQIFYAIALDLDGDEVASILDHPSYRYRRIMYPVIASLGGLLEGRALVWGMIVTAVASFGVAAGSVAAIAAGFGRSDWFAMAVALNPGMWLSVRLLTSDATALAAMAVGVLAVAARWRFAALAFAVSGLSKDIYLVTPAGLMGSKETRRWSFLLVSAAVLAAWSVYLMVNVDAGFTESGNLTWPLLGIIEAAPTWASADWGDLFYLGFALLSVIAGLFHGLFRRSWLRWPILGWSILGLASSSWVWDFGNNAARAFAPIVVLIAAAETAGLRSLSDARPLRGSVV